MWSLDLWGCLHQFIFWALLIMLIVLATCPSIIIMLNENWGLLLLALGQHAFLYGWHLYYLADHPLTVYWWQHYRILTCNGSTMGTIIFVMLADRDIWLTTTQPFLKSHVLHHKTCFSIASNLPSTLSMLFSSAEGWLNLAIYYLPI